MSGREREHAQEAQGQSVFKLRIAPILHRYDENGFLLVGTIDPAKSPAAELKPMLWRLAKAQLGFNNKLELSSEMPKYLPPLSLKVWRQQGWRFFFLESLSLSKGSY